MIACGHLYDPTTGEGIEWQPEQARLWQAGRVVAEAWHNTPTPHAFFHNLRALTAFPEVSEWWMGEDWTGKVRVSEPLGLMDVGELYGYLWYDGDETPHLWTATDDAPISLAVVLPPGVAVSALTLRLAIMRQVVAVLQGAPSMAFQPITSRVPSTELASWLPTDHTALTEALPRRLTAWVDPDDVDGLEREPRRWALADLPDLAVRDLYCWQLGLAESVAG